MARIAVLIGGALANAQAFTGCSYLFSRLSKRQEEVIERLQKLQIEWVHKRQELIKESCNKQLRLEKAAETEFTNLNDAM